MKSELRIGEHALIPGAVVVEIWHDGLFIGQVTGADGPGVRVLSKYDMASRLDQGAVNVTEVRIGCPGKANAGAPAKTGDPADREPR
ncbi:MAG TPA: hypothetical protein VKA46_00325 [Gemmataceae bacterium]|nr:hypothetical protein [Gemmataceae bacterium]